MTTIDHTAEEPQGNGKADSRGTVSRGAPGPGQFSSQVLRSYESAVANGFYLPDRGGLEGKFDNVRRCWEDQITRYVLHDFIAPLVQRKQKSLTRIRALDLGAGSGEGYEILTSLRADDNDLLAREVHVLPNELMGFYMGLDLSPTMVSQAEMAYGHQPKVAFETVDLRKGLGPAKEHPPYDIYFSSYGSLSHLTDTQLLQLIEQIIDQSGDQCLFVADLLGRYSYEWPCYWGDEARDDQQQQPYSMSYLYPPEVTNQVEVECFPMRYWGGREFDRFFSQIAQRKGVKVRNRKLHDRSVLVGRHMDTCQYNAHAPCIRKAINHLHEFNRRTDLKSLVFDYTPHPRHPSLNAFFERFQMAWNAVVYAAIKALDHWDNPKVLCSPSPEDYPPTVCEAIDTFRKVVQHVQWFRMGDPRASIVEPQLGYILRNLEMDLQKGLGAGHGLLAVYEQEKEAS